MTSAQSVISTDSDPGEAPSQAWLPSGAGYTPGDVMWSFLPLAAPCVLRYGAEEIPRP